MGNGRQDAADLEFREGTHRSPTAKTLYATARILAARGMDRQCENMLKKAIKEYPRFMPAYCDLAELYLRQRRPAAAAVVLGAGLEIAPNEAVLLNNLGMCRLVEGSYGRALGAFGRAAAAAPQGARYRANMAVALGMLGRYEEALSLYRQVLPPAGARYNLALLCRAREDHARAEKEFAAAEALRAQAQAGAPRPQR